jgi:hypothetical protein
MKGFKYLYFLAINIILFTSSIFLFSTDAVAQAENFSAIRTEVHFDETIRDWDGFGFNYVETAQTMDYDEDPQEYGGFSLLDERLHPTDHLIIRKPQKTCGISSGKD